MMITIERTLIMLTSHYKLSSAIQPTPGSLVVRLVAEKVGTHY